MKSPFVPIAALLLLLAPAATPETFPTATISNGLIDAKLFPPDAEKGYYQAMRFDWSGMIYSLRYAGHEFFGLRSPEGTPALERNGMGLAEEFRREESEIGYEEAAAGEGFIRIGIGELEKPEEDSFRWIGPYKILNRGERTLSKEKDWIEFTHTLESGSGYGYIYTKRVSLTPGQPVLVISHRLRNIGDKILDTRQYNHNFFMIDGLPAGPEILMRLPFTPRLERDSRKLLMLRNNEIHYARELKKGDTTFAILAGHDNSSEHFGFRIEHTGARVGVRMQSDSELDSFAFWTNHECVTPEPFVKIRVEPGHEQAWTLNYEFYRLD